MKVKVTERDIKNGQRGSDSHCPIALALRRQTHKKVSVMYTNCYIKNKPVRPMDRYHIPDIAADFIGKFDHCEEVQPFEFEIEKCAENSIICKTIY